MNDALPVAFHELVVAPAALALAFLHARRALGASRACVELLALALYGFALERVAILVFASHAYGDGWRLAPSGVPLAVAAVWAAVIVSAMAVAAQRGPVTAFGRGAAAALVGVSLDLLMEPVAVRAGLWRWTPPGPWLGVPVGNFVGWAVIIGSYTVGAERWGDASSLLAQTARRAGLGAASILALVAVGMAWRALGAERIFEGGGGWAAWAVALALAAGLRLRRRSAETGSTLAGRLGTAAGAFPAAVLGGVAAVFVTDALRLGGPPLRIVATGSVLVLLWLLVERPRVVGLGAWRSRTLAHLSGVQGLVQVLMKPRNDEPWTAEDRAFLGTELRALARVWAPALLLFLLPGSVVLLPAYAWLLDRRRQQR